MKIIYVGAFRFPCYDAASARVLNVGKTLREAGHNVQYISMGGKERDVDINTDGTHVYDGFHYLVTNELSSQGSIISRIKNKINRGNVTIKELKLCDLNDTLVIAYNPMRGFLKKLIQLSKKRRFRLAVDLTEWYDNNELHLTDRLLYHICMTKTMQKIKNKIVISSYLNNYYPDSNNVIIPATCDKDDKKWMTSTDKISSFNGLTLIYAGTPAKKDLLHTAINVVNNLNHKGLNIKFLILGATRDHYLKQFSDKITAIELSENIMFMGKVSQQEVPAYYKHADFMILLRESNRKSNAGFPTKFAESMIAGVPVISNSTSDISKYLIDNKNGYLLATADYDCVEKALMKIYKEFSFEKSQSMKANAKKTGEQIFDYHNYIESLNDFVLKTK